MRLAVGLPEFIVELAMEALLIYATLIFWRRYRRTSNRTLLILTIAFAFFFTAHTILSVILEDLMGYKFPEPFDPHHAFFVIALILIIYLTNKTQWKVKLPKPPAHD